MSSYERARYQLELATAEAVEGIRRLLREGSPVDRLKVAMMVLRIRGKSSAARLTGPAGPADEAMARDLAEWILVTARADPEAYAQLRGLHAAVRQRSRTGRERGVDSGPPGLTSGGDVV